MKKILAMMVALGFAGFSHAWAAETVNNTNVQVNVDSNVGTQGFRLGAFDDRGEFSVNPGIALSGGAASNYAGDSFSLDLDWLTRIHPVVQFGTELGYIFDSKLKGTLPSRLAGDVGAFSTLDATGGDVNERILHVTPEFKIGPKLLYCNYQFQPYVIGGGGIYWTHYTSGNVNLDGPNGTVTPYSYGGADDVNAGWNLGGGASFLFPQQFAIGFEVRYHRIMYHNADDVTYITPALRLSLFFK